MHFPHYLIILGKVTAFAIIVILIVFLFNKWLKHRERSWAFILKQDNNKALAPLKISAYERIVIMLERITPQSLVMRYNVGTGNAALLQMEIIRALREEFEHNISLQMYVSPECWEKVRKAREESAELIKVAFTRVRPEGPAMELGREILKLEAAVGNSAIREALLGVRMEMARYF